MKRWIDKLFKFILADGKGKPVGDVKLFYIDLRKNIEKYSTASLHLAPIF